MEQTGERLVPGSGKKTDKVFAEHMARYRFVTSFIKNKKVLDIACGSGYGSAMIAEAGAARVVGGDIDVATIESARKNYQTNNLTFEVVDAVALPFEDKSFEAVVSLETIEHSSEAEKMMRELARVLTDDGVFILSTPNREATKKLGINNPFHVGELNKEELIALMGKYFQRLEIFGQRPLRELSLKQKLIRKAYFLYTKIKWLEFLKRWFPEAKRQGVGEQIDGLGDDCHIEAIKPGKEYLYYVVVATSPV
ncbi:MAG TPA: class I SAM-dependent methyltransferase [Patescibacteria group bacterium]|nr:class I SAM-dependent methyltransferase [Patescibacteria group bacterium]